MNNLIQNLKRIFTLFPGLNLTLKTQRIPTFTHMDARSGMFKQRGLVMKKHFSRAWYILIPVALLSLLIGIQPVGAATNRLGWSADQDATWKRMKAENHKYWQDLKTQADKYNYGDKGMRRGLVYLLTGDVNYANRAWAAVDQWCGRTYGGTPTAGKESTWCSTAWEGKNPRDGTRADF